MFLLFLNTRPRFRVKEHSGSGAPPLSPPVIHMNQDLHSYLVLILHLGFIGCQYSKEAWAKQPFHPDLLGCLSENPAAPSRLKLRAGSEAVSPKPPFPEGRQRPLDRGCSIPTLGTQG